LTHCSAKKDQTLENTGIKVTPDKLYTSTKLLGFVEKCKAANCNWAIFSDKYGIWFPNELHEWYDKNPNDVTEKEFQELKNDFEKKLASFDEIHFYYNPGRFHPLYNRLLNEAKVKSKIVKFTHKNKIK
jgi:hypothetical protein